MNWLLDSTNVLKIRENYTLYYEREECFMKKVDIVKVMSIGGTILGIAGTLISGYASNKEMARTVEEKVAEALAKQVKN